MFRAVQSDEIWGPRTPLRTEGRGDGLKSAHPGASMADRRDPPKIGENAPGEKGCDVSAISAFS